nr:hypothetical protein Iba_chr12eCG7660 [Ipomoea batatas]
MILFVLISGNSQVQASITDMSGGKGLNMEKGTIGIYSTPGSKVMMTLNCTLVILFNYWFKALWFHLKPAVEHLSCFFTPISSFFCSILLGYCFDSRIKYGSSCFPC